MRYRNLLRAIPLAVREVTTGISAYVVERFDNTLVWLRTAIYFAIPLTLVGITLASIGFHTFSMNLLWMIGVGRFIMAISAFIGAFALLVVFLKTGGLTLLGVLASNLLASVSRLRNGVAEGTTVNTSSASTQTVAGSNTTTVTNQVATTPAQTFTSHQATKLLRNMIGILAWITCFNVLAILFPVFTSMTAMFGAAAAGLLIGMTTAAYSEHPYYAKYFLWGTGIVACTFFVLSMIFPAQFAWMSNEWLTSQRNGMVRAEATMKIEANRTANLAYYQEKQVELETRRQNGTFTKADQQLFDRYKAGVNRLMQPTPEFEERSTWGDLPGGSMTVTVPGSIGAATATIPEPPSYSSSTALAAFAIGMVLVAGYIFLSPSGSKK